MSALNYRQELTKPYTHTTNYTRVKLLPQELNNDLYINLKNRVIEKVEGRCNKLNYVVKVHDLEIDSKGEIEPEDFSCGVVFNVTYRALVCKLVEGMVVVCAIHKISPEFIITSNKGFGGIIQMATVNKERFSFDRRESKFYEGDRLISVGDHIIVQVKKINYFANQKEIMMMGELLRVASDEEVADYFYSETKPTVGAAPVEFDEH